MRSNSYSSLGFGHKLQIIERTNNQCFGSARFLDTQTENMKGCVRHGNKKCYDNKFLAIHVKKILMNFCQEWRGSGIWIRKSPPPPPQDNKIIRIRPDYGSSDTTNNDIGLT
jgi:hypothetical protein